MFEQILFYEQVIKIRQDLYEQLLTPLNIVTTTATDDW